MAVGSRSLLILYKHVVLARLVKGDVGHHSLGIRAVVNDLKRAVVDDVDPLGVLGHIKGNPRVRVLGQDADVVSVVWVQSLGELLLLEKQ